MNTPTGRPTFRSNLAVFALMMVFWLILSHLIAPPIRLQDIGLGVVVALLVVRFAPRQRP
jgi:multisubunit Na+/H+ antiporter MnhE subunit